MKANPAISNRLERTRDRLTERALRIEQDRRRNGQPVSADFSEQATQVENDEVLDRLSESTAAELRQVNRAIERADAGVYGLCERCGRAIEAARLSAVPEATTCTHCAGP